MYYKRLYGRSIIGVYLDKLGFEKYYIYCLIILFIWLYTGYFSVLLWGVLLLSILGILKEKSPKIDYYYKLSPVLVSDIQDKKLYDKLVNKFKKVNDNTYQSISEIKYDPNDIDKERFLLSMNDGNYVYVTMSKFDNINDYLEISKTLGTKNGILYLDYGNYFVPKE